MMKRKIEDLEAFREDDRSRKKQMAVNKEAQPNPDLRDEMELQIDERAVPELLTADMESLVISNDERGQDPVEFRVDPDYQTMIWVNVSIQDEFYMFWKDKPEG